MKKSLNSKKSANTCKSYHKKYNTETLEMEKIQHGNSRIEKMKTNDRKFVNKEKITKQMYKKKKIIFGVVFWNKMQSTTKM